MASRPQHKVTGSKLEITIPSGWFITIAAISRERYNQVIGVTDNVFGDLNTTFIGSKFTKPPTAMTDLRSGNDSMAITAQRQEISLVLDFFYSQDKGLSRNLQSIAASKYQSYELDVVEVTKPPTAPATVPDYVTLMIFVEDTKDQIADHGMFDDAIATVHIVKKDVKEGSGDSSDSDDD